MASPDISSSIPQLVQFCSDVNVAVDEKGQCLLKAIVCNLQYVDRPSLFSRVFGTESYVNWEVVDTRHKRAQSRKKGNPVGTSSTWCCYLSFVQGNRQAFQAQTHQARLANRPFYLVYDTVVSEFRNADGVSTELLLTASIWSFFIINIIGLTPMASLEMCMNMAMKRSVKQESQSIMIQVSSEKFTPQQYESTISWLISSGVLAINMEKLNREIQFYRASIKDSENIMRVHTIQVSSSGRPSLLRIAAEARTSAPIKSAQSSYDDYYTFDGFVRRMKFTSSISTRLQQQAYWLASQRESFGWREYTSDILNPDHVASMEKFGDIHQPDYRVIAEMLQNTVIVGPPFQALHEFRSSCLVSMPALDRVTMTANEVFRLYVASYQRRSIWKEVWKLVKPILSTQIIKDVEAFVAAVPIDSQSTASVVFYGTAHPPSGSTLRGQRQGTEVENHAFQSVAAQQKALSEDTIYMAGNNRAAAISMAAARALEKSRQRRSMLGKAVPEQEFKESKAELKQAELKQAELKQAELKQAELKQAELELEEPIQRVDPEEQNEEIEPPLEEVEHQEEVDPGEQQEEVDPVPESDHEVNVKGSTLMSPLQGSQYDDDYDDESQCLSSSSPPPSSSEDEMM